MCRSWPLHHLTTPGRRSMVEERCHVRHAVCLLPFFRLLSLPPFPYQPLFCVVVYLIAEVLTPLCFATSTDSFVPLSAVTPPTPPRLACMTVLFIPKHSDAVLVKRCISFVLALHVVLCPAMPRSSMHNRTHGGERMQAPVSDVPCVTCHVRCAVRLLPFFRLLSLPPFRRWRW